MKELASLGPWFMREGRDLSVLASQIDTLIADARLVVTETDTAALDYQLPKTGWTQSSGHAVDVSHHSLYLPIGGGINVPLKPVSFDGREHAARLDLVGDHLQILVPYLFHWVPQRVDYKTYSVTRVRSIS